MEKTYQDYIEFEIIKKLWKYGCSASEANNLIYPLSWYIYSGRCSAERLRKIVNATGRQLAAIAKRLMAGKSHDETIKHVMAYVDGMQGGLV